MPTPRTILSEQRAWASRMTAIAGADVAPAELRERARALRVDLAGRRIARGRLLALIERAREIRTAYASIVGRRGWDNRRFGSFPRGVRTRIVRKRRRLREIIDHAAAIAQSLAPLDIDANFPLYVVTRHDLQRAGLNFPAREVMGITGPCMDQIVLPAIGDRWHGRGLGVVLDERELLGDTRWNDGFGQTRRHWIESFAARVLDITLHELAHGLADGYRGLLERSTISEADAAGERSRLLGEPASIGRPPWHLHGPRFIRALIHLEHRAKRAGHRVGLYTMARFSTYALSPAWMYREALGDEPRRMVDRSFVEINAEAMPASFVRLFNSDALAWVNASGGPESRERVSMATPYLASIEGRGQTDCPCPAHSNADGRSAAGETVEPIAGTHAAACEPRDITKQQYDGIDGGGCQRFSRRVARDCDGVLNRRNPELFEVVTSTSTASKRTYDHEAD